jgi:hypothetical protein
MPSFDCHQATDTIELFICYHRCITCDLGPLDVTLSHAWTAALAQARDKPALIASQRHWLASRSEGCGIPDPRYQVAMQTWENVGRCVMAKYEERIAELRQLAGAADPYAHLTVERSGAVAVDPDRDKRLESAAQRGDLLTLRRILAEGGDELDLKPALIKAVTRGSVPIVRALVDAGGPLDQPLAYKNGIVTGSALRLAADLDRRAVTGFLLSRGASIDAPGGAPIPPLVFAVMTADPAVVKQALARHSDLEERYKGWLAANGTALLAAVGRGLHDIARLLLEAGADANTTNDEGWTPLLYAGFNRDLAMVKLLLAHGADPTARTAKMGAALHFAQDTEIARALIAAGADVTAEPILLLDAAETCNLPLVRLLLQHGADPQAAGAGGRPAPMIWQDRRHYASPPDLPLPIWAVRTMSCPPFAWPATAHRR